MRLRNLVQLRDAFKKGYELIAGHQIWKARKRGSKL